MLMMNTLLVLGPTTLDDSLNGSQKGGRYSSQQVYLIHLIQKTNLTPFFDPFLHLDADPFAVPFYTAMGFTVEGFVPSGSIEGRELPHMTYELD